MNQNALSGYEWDNHRVAAHPTYSDLIAEDSQPQQDRAGVVGPNLYAFGSAHAGGLNMAFCDGSVRTISYDIDRDTHRLNAVRNDGGDTGRNVSGGRFGS